MDGVNPKFASRVGEELWLAHDYGDVYAKETTNDGTQQIRIAVSHAGSHVLRRLSQALNPPFYLLYVLVVYRGGGAVGRYQSDELSREQLDQLFSRYEEFWDSDGRHSVWLRSQRDDATLVYDGHNLIYAYGPLERYGLILESLGYSETEEVTLSFEHEHRYHAQFDEFERELTTRLADRKSELRPGDENPC